MVGLGFRDRVIAFVASKRDEAIKELLTSNEASLEYQAALVVYKEYTEREFGLAYQGPLPRVNR